jgi:Lipocalin-like domain
MKFKNLMLALAVTMMVASCDKKKEGDATEKEGTEAAADAGKEAEAPAAAPEADAKTMITKTWVLSDVDATAMINKLPKEQQEARKKSMDEGMAKMKGNMTFEFMADGKFVSMMKMDKDENKTEGTWTLSEDGKTITTTESKGGKKSDVTLLVLTNDALELSSKENSDMIMKFVPKK